MSSAMQPLETGRAWAEVDLGAVSYNASALRSVLPDGCELMAVVKADAYGHGAVKTASLLQREGVSSFAVATVGEGLALRESGVNGEILVLGYTHPQDAGLLHTHSLTQLAVDGAYAKALDNTGSKLNVHIAIDTGMHRLGIEYPNISEMENVYTCRNLTVTGVASHLASSDSLLPDDTEFTKLQIDRFFDVINLLKGKGYEVGKRHIQASYGLLNYPDIACDYVRTGIALYGVKSNNSGVKVKLELKPALSLKARVAEVRQINAGESVSYGRTYIAEKPLTLATVCIGYADGVPRQLSGNNGVCLVRGKTVPIIGRICMDLLMLDVSDVDSASPGDVVTLIGSDGNATVRCEDFAEASGTITNDILCRLGSRLPRVYIDS